MEYIYNAIISADQEHNKKDYHEIVILSQCLCPNSLNSWLNIC